MHVLVSCTQKKIGTPDICSLGPRSTGNGSKAMIYVSSGSTFVRTRGERADAGNFKGSLTTDLGVD